MFCDLSKLQNFFAITKSEAESVKNLFCSDTWKNYVNDLINSFGVFDVKNNVSTQILLQKSTRSSEVHHIIFSLA